jgi:hypothetical protein
MSCPNRTTCELWGQVGRFTACSAVATYSHVLHALAQHRGQKAGSWGLASASAAFNLPRPTALLCCLWPNWPAKLENPFFRWREASTRCSVNIYIKRRQYRISPRARRRLHRWAQSTATQETQRLYAALGSAL